MSGDERELQAGRDYPIWPRLKWGHALRLHNKLLYDYQIWRSSLASETRAEYSADRREVTFYATIKYSPPLYEWSLAFGDIIHNYRAALDALAWGLAHLDGKQPRPQDEKRIYFPLKKSPTEFEKEAKKTLASVPDFVLRRMRSVQPYHGGAPELGIGKILHTLDIQDKHRSSVEIHASAAAKGPYMVRSSIEDGFDPSATDFEEEWVAPDRQIQDGDKVVILRFTHPVREEQMPDLPLKLTIDHGGERYELFELLQMIEDQVRVTFDVIDTGHLPGSGE